MLSLSLINSDLSQFIISSTILDKSLELELEKMLWSDRPLLACNEWHVIFKELKNKHKNHFIITDHHYKMMESLWSINDSCVFDSFFLALHHLGGSIIVWLPLILCQLLTHLSFCNSPFLECLPTYITSMHYIPVQEIKNRGN